MSLMIEEAEQFVARIADPLPYPTAGYFTPEAGIPQNVAFDAQKGRGFGLAVGQAVAKGLPLGCQTLQRGRNDALDERFQIGGIQRNVHDEPTKNGPQARWDACGPFVSSRFNIAAVARVARLF